MEKKMETTIVYGDYIGTQALFGCFPKLEGTFLGVRIM